MPLVVKVRTKGGVPRIPKKEINKLISKSLRHVAFMWWNKHRLIHFTGAGARKFGYGHRKTKDVRTETVKRTKKGKPKAPSGKPLVWSGRSLALSQQYRIRSTSKRSTLTMPIRAFNFKPKNNPKLNMRKEFTTIHKDENRSLRRAGTIDLKKRLAKYKVSARVRVINK